MESVNTIARNASTALCHYVSSETPSDDEFENYLWIVRSEVQDASKVATGVAEYRVTFYLAAYVLLNVSK